MQCIYIRTSIVIGGGGIRAEVTATAVTCFADPRSSGAPTQRREFHACADMTDDVTMKRVCVECGKESADQQLYREFSGGTIQLSQCVSVL